MHYGWPLLRNLTLLSILTQWYSNNRKFRHNIQTASFSPFIILCHTGWAQMCFPDASLGCSHSPAALAGGGIWCTGRLCPALHGPSVDDGAGFPLPKELSFCTERGCQGWRSYHHNTDTCRARLEVKSYSPRGVLWERGRKLQLGHQLKEISTCVGEQQVGAARKQQEESYRRAKERIWKSFPVLCRRNWLLMVPHVWK